MNDSESRRLTEFLLADIVDIAADAVICIDAEQKITLFNEGAIKIFGWTADEVMGKPLEMLLPERFRDAHAGHVAGFRNSKDHARRMGERREISGLRKNGEEFPAEAAITKVHMGDKVVFSVVLRDITDQVQLQKRLQRAVVARDETVGMVAHDLRNPLSAIKMLAATVLAEGESLPNPAREKLDMIRSAASQMDRLIEDLLDVTRVEAGRMRVEPESVVVTELIDAALTTLRPLVESAKLQLSVDAGPRARRVLADRPRIGQVLSNLVGNSVKFTPPGGSITIRAAAHDEGVCFSVADTGSGIAKEQLPSVFDRFWQAQSPIRVRGAGLGLPIARGIVQAHGGRMWAESEPQRGSTFYFILPADD